MCGAVGLKSILRILTDMVFALHTPALSELSIDVAGVCMIDQTIEAHVAPSDSRSLAQPSSSRPEIRSSSESSMNRMCH